MKINLGSWDLWRSTRMGLGILFIVMGLIRADYVLAAAGAFLVVHAYINACAACQTGQCEIPENKNNGQLQ